MKEKNILLVILLFLAACGGLDDAGKVLKNEKITNTDEFLVKKKNPLVLPPDFEKIPEPGSINKNKESEQDKIKDILSAPKSLKKNIGKSTSTEKSIINKIRK